MQPSEQCGHFPSLWRDDKGPRGNEGLCFFFFVLFVLFVYAVPAAPAGTAVEMVAAFRPFPRCLWPPLLRPPPPDLSCRHTGRRGWGSKSSEKEQTQGKDEVEVSFLISLCRIYNLSFLSYSVTLKCFWAGDIKCSFPLIKWGVYVEWCHDQCLWTAVWGHAGLFTTEPNKNIDETAQLRDNVHRVVTADEWCCCFFTVYSMYFSYSYTQQDVHVLFLLLVLYSTL